VSGSQADQLANCGYVSEHICCCRTVVELRQYVARPGRRDELIALFEERFIEGQEDMKKI
jgi:hypothetical protein